MPAKLQSCPAVQQPDPTSPPSASTPVARSERESSASCGAANPSSAPARADSDSAQPVSPAPEPAQPQARTTERSPPMPQPSSFRRTSPVGNKLIRERLSIGPHRAICEGLLLPDGNRLLQRIYQPAARVERHRAVRRRNHDQHTRLAHHQPPQPMHQPHIAHAELRHRLRRQPLHLLQRHLAIGLVVEVHGRPPARVVAHNAVEDAYRAIAAGLHRRNNRLRGNRRIHNLNPHSTRSRARSSPPLTGGSSATSSPSRSTIDGDSYSRLTATARLRHNRSSRPDSATLPIDLLDVRPRKRPSNSPTVAPSGNSATSSETPNTSRNTPKYSTFTRTRSEYPARRLGRIEKSRRLGRVPHPSPLNPRKPGHRMRTPLGLPRGRDEDILHHAASRQHSIANQRPVAPPWDRLGTHHRDAAKTRQAHQPCNLDGELFRLHVVGVATEALVPPAVINALIAGQRMAKTAQPLAPDRSDPSAFQLGKQSRLFVLRIPARARNAPHIHQRAPFVLLARLQKDLDRKRRMPNRQHGHLDASYPTTAYPHVCFHRPHTERDRSGNFLLDWYRANHYSHPLHQHHRKTGHVARDHKEPYFDPNDASVLPARTGVLCEIGR